MKKNKKNMFFGIIALLAITAIAGAYQNPQTQLFTEQGIPRGNTAVVPVSTVGPSQVKLGNLGIRKAFHARGNAILKDHVRVGGSLFGGDETSPRNSTVLSIGRSTEAFPTGVLVHNDIITSAQLQTQGIAGSGTVPVCSNAEGFVVLCDEPITAPTTPSASILGSVSGYSETQIQTAIGGSANTSSYLFNSDYYQDTQLYPISSNPQSQLEFLAAQAVCRGVGPNSSPYPITLPALLSSARSYGSNWPNKPFPSSNDIIYTSPNGNVPHNGGDLWWGMTYNGRRYAAKISPAGAIVNSFSCL